MLLVQASHKIFLHKKTEKLENPTAFTGLSRCISQHNMVQRPIKF